MYYHIQKVAEDIRNKAKGKKISFISGNFNVVHPGHLRFIRFARDCGDFLVCAVHADHLPGALVPVAYRLEAIRALQLVDYCFVLSEEVSELLRELKPEVVVKGKEYEIRHNVEEDIVTQYGGKLLFSSGEQSFSTIDLIKQEFDRVSLFNFDKPLDYLKRHAFNFSDLYNDLKKMKNLKVLVIGDSIVDEYLTCDPLGMSQEDPTIVVSPVDSKKFIGGASIVAAHAAGFGAKVYFCSVVGNDSGKDFLEEKLNLFNVDHSFLIDESRPTTLKQKYRSSQKTLLRVNYLKQHSLSKELQDKLYGKVAELVPDLDLLIFSDFNYGCLPQSLVNQITVLCRKHNVKMVADSQSSSQIGDISRFRGMSLITPTEREARLALRDFESGLVAIADKLAEVSQADNVIITLGSEGIFVHPKWQQTELPDDRLPAFNSNPKDTAGAGDSFLTSCSMAFTVNNNLWRSAYIGCIAAACQVSRLGNTPLSCQQLERELQ